MGYETGRRSPWRRETRTEDKKNKGLPWRSGSETFTKASPCPNPPRPPTLPPVADQCRKHPVAAPRTPPASDHKGLTPVAKSNPSWLFSEGSSSSRYRFISNSAHNTQVAVWYFLLLLQLVQVATSALTENRKTTYCDKSGGDEPQLGGGFIFRLGGGGSLPQLSPSPLCCFLLPPSVNYTEIYKRHQNYFSKKKRKKRDKTKHMKGREEVPPTPL